MDWYQTVFELIDMRSFSNLWYWIALAVVWSTTSHWVLGVPFDMIVRARREGGQAEIDFHDILRVNVNRLLYIARVSGLWVLALTCFLLSGLAILGFYYWVEFAQAVFLLAFPLCIIGLMSISTAIRIAEDDEALNTEALFLRLRRHRFWTQVIGMVSIFITSIWGMYQNLDTGALGALLGG